MDSGPSQIFEINANLCDRGSVLILASSRRAAVRSAIGNTKASSTGSRLAV
jgi:hypothetical protein